VDSPIDDSSAPRAVFHRHCRARPAPRRVLAPPAGAAGAGQVSLARGGVFGLRVGLFTPWEGT